MKVTTLVLLYINSLVWAKPSYKPGQRVHTTSGEVFGHAASRAPQVSEYLGIPFARPPIGDLRFRAPQPYHGNMIIKAAEFGPSCPLASTYTELLQPNKDSGLNFTVAGEYIMNVIAQTKESHSEDCLTLNIWTKPQTGEKEKAVLLWLYGGGFVGGGSASPFYNGARLAEEQDVIIVTSNYRINIFGFPGIPGAHNVGFLDQRLAVQWVRDNIAQFGGDAKRITIFGESAGGASVDAYSYAWVSDPIVAGFIAQSGTVDIAAPYTADTALQLWHNATSMLGCGDATSKETEVLSCMQTMPLVNITKVISNLPNFGPSIDNEVVFSDYPSRRVSGNFIKKPMMIGHTDFEAGMFDITARLRGNILPPDFWRTMELVTFFCPAAIRANVSASWNVPIWRYRYFGEFANMNISSAINARAYHGAEINPLFDTFPEGAGIPASTKAQLQIAHNMRRAWAAFAKDPENGLLAKEFGGAWPLFDPAKETLIRLGYGKSTGTSLASPASYDAACGSMFPSSAATKR